MISSNSSNYFQKHVLIFPSSTQSGDASCLFKDACSWISENRKNSSLTFKFIKNKFVLTSYSLAVHQGKCSPVEWIVEGYNLDNKLYPISYQKTYMCTNTYHDSINQVCHANSPTHYTVDKTYPSAFIRITQISERECSGNKNSFPLEKIVFVGFFCDKDHSRCNKANAYNFQILFMFILVYSTT